MSFLSTPSIFFLRCIPTLSSTVTTPVSSRAGGTEGTGTLRPTMFSVEFTDSCLKLTTYRMSGLDMSLRQQPSQQPITRCLRLLLTPPSACSHPFPASSLHHRHQGLTPWTKWPIQTCVNPTRPCGALPAHTPQTPLLALSNPDKKSMSSPSRASTSKYLIGCALILLFHQPLSPRKPSTC